MIANNSIQRPNISDSPSGPGSLPNAVDLGILELLPPTGAPFIGRSFGYSWLRGPGRFGSIRNSSLDMRSVLQVILVSRCYIT